MHPFKRFPLYARSGGRFPRWPRPRAGAGRAAGAIADALTTARVKAAIADEPTLRTGAIEVESVGGMVRLSGVVGKAEDIARAAEVAAQVEGVKSVSNDLRLP